MFSIVVYFRIEGAKENENFRLIQYETAVIRPQFHGSIHGYNGSNNMSNEQ